MTRYTVAQVADWGPEELEASVGLLRMSDLDFTPSEAALAADAWVYLLGAAAPDDVAEARDEALSDGELFICLNKPVGEFIDWFRVQDWSFFGRDHDSEYQWAWRVLDRARALRTALGPHMACNLSVSEGG